MVFPWFFIRSQPKQWSKSPHRGAPPRAERWLEQAAEAGQRSDDSDAAAKAAATKRYPQSDGNKRVINILGST